MQQFEFVLVLQSIIVGLGITEILTNVARQIKNRKTIIFSWPHMVTVMIIFIALLQQWWESWWLQSIESWNFPTLLLMLGGPVGLYILSHLLFPEKIENTDFEKFYYSNSKILWFIATFIVIVATLFKPISFGDSLINIDNLESLILAMLFFTLAIFKNKLFHKIAVIGVFSILILDITIFSFYL